MSARLMVNATVFNLMIGCSLMIYLFSWSQLLINET